MYKKERPHCNKYINVCTYIYEHLGMCVRVCMCMKPEG